MLLLALLALAQSTDGAAGVDGRGAPTVTVPRLVAEVTIDGVLDEPVWQQAVRLDGFSQYEPVDGRPAEERTEVLVWYAPDAIHFGIIASDRDPSSIRATRADRDNIDGEDHVTLFLDTFLDRRRAYFFAVNPLGVQQDGIRSEGTSSAGRMFGGDTDKSPDFLFESQGRLTEQGYVVEVRIPFKSLRYGGGETQSWGFNVQRRVQRTGYTDTWTDVRRAGASFLAQAGTLAGLTELQRGIVVEAQPFVTAKANGARIPTTNAFERESIDPDIGINLRAGLTNLALDATVNPDFSQVESDAAQVTVNERFALFFTEKRPFFLEGLDLFNTPNQLVYTRRIVSPIGGAKLTGKFGAFGVAHLTAVDRGAPGLPDALFNVTRLRRDFGSNSLVGLTYTDRSELEGSYFNRVLAGDMRLVFARLYFFEAQLGRSWTHVTPPQDGTDITRGAPLWRMQLDRTGRHFGFNYAINAIGQEFRTDAGFVPRTGIVDAHAFNRISLYGERGAFIETVTFFISPTRIWRYGELDESPIEGGEGVNTMIRLRGGWQVNTEIERRFVRLDPAEYDGIETDAPGGPVAYVPLEEVSGPALSFSVSTPTATWADANARIERGRVAIFAEGSEGTATTVSGGFNLRPTASIRVNATTTWQRIVRRRDGSEFARSIIPRLRVEIQPTRAFFFRAVAQHTTDRVAALTDARTGQPLLVNGETSTPMRNHALRFDLLASFEPTPGTVAFFGYGSSLDAPDAFRFSHMTRMADGFFLKLAYRFRR